MSVRIRRYFLFLLALTLFSALGYKAAAADAASPPGVARAETTPPLPPAPKSPIESFRRLLAMNPGQREQALTNRPPEIRKKILDKVQQYLALKADERELRLRSTEVEWYFLHLRQVSPAARQIQSVPEQDRQMVESRLAVWDRLSPEQQQEVTKYMPLLTNSSYTSASNPGDEKARDNFNRKLDDWKKLPPDERRDIFGRFQQFFALDDAEREKTLHVLSEPERAQIEKALLRFEQMPAQRRQKILAAWPRLEALSDAQREEFVRNADRWEAMTPAERQTLRALFMRLPSPLPPTPPNFPPLPTVPPRSLRLAGTNANSP